MYEMKRTEANRVCREKKRIWINNGIKKIEETRMRQDNFLKKLGFLINNNWCCQNFVRKKLITCCQNVETCYRDGNYTL
jgi:hypothetical protein